MSSESPREEDRERSGRGLALIGVMVLSGLALLGAAVHRWRTSTRDEVATWTAGETTYASFVRRAAWSDAWMELCREDVDDARRWCRSLPDGHRVTDAQGDADVVLVRVVGPSADPEGAVESLWILDARDGGTIATTSFGAGAPMDEPKWVHLGTQVVIAWPRRIAARTAASLGPATLRAIDLRSGAVEWSFPLDDDQHIDWLRTRDGRLIGHSAGEREIEIDPETGAITPFEQLPP